jgi:hypothetical protein
MRGANPGQARKVDQNTKAYTGSVATLPDGCSKPKPVPGKGGGKRK